MSKIENNVSSPFSHLISNFGLGRIISVFLPSGQSKKLAQVNLSSLPDDGSLYCEVRRFGLINSESDDVAMELEAASYDSEDPFGHSCFDRAGRIIALAEKSFTMKLSEMPEHDQKFFAEMTLCPRCCLIYADTLKGELKATSEFRPK